jgi:hypothetical protein
MRLEGFVEKGWGHELIWATNDKYCGKLLKFNKGAKFSMHFMHRKMRLGMCSTVSLKFITL